MTSILRRLFGESESAEPASVGTKAPAPAPAHSPSAVGTARAAASCYTPSDSANAGNSALALAEPLAADTALPLVEQFRDQFHSGLRLVEAELVSDDPIAGDLKLLIQALRDQPIDQIRQLPLAAQRALSLLHADASTSRLVQLFEKDPVICQALLKQVNSAFYNPSGGRIVSLTDAISRMGRAGVQGVVMMQAVSGMVSRPGGHLDAMVQQVWDHMVRVGPLCRHLAPAFGANADQAFLLGLLHDVGKLAIFDRVSELRSSHRRTMVLEKHMMGRALAILHESLGGLIIEQWQLDSDVARALATHHREPRPVRRDVLSEVVHVAERVDLARENKQFLDMQAMWDDAGLTANMDVVSDAISRYSPN